MVPKKIKAVLLDRDGVINQEGGHVFNLDDFKMLPGVAEAILKLNEAKIPVAVVTNQSGIARGLMTVEDLEAIHDEMKRLLLLGKAHINALYYSPWHPDQNLEGGVNQWLCNHEDRKPGVGMLRKALKEFGVLPNEAVMIGDSAKDSLAADRLGVSFYGVRSSKVGELNDAEAFDTLLELVQYFEKEKAI